MTEPQPIWFVGNSPASESDILASTAASLRAAGWEVLVTAQDRATRRQSRGLPDLLCWNLDHTLYVEGKTKGGKLRQSQREFAARIAPHEGPHLRRITIRHPEMIDEWLTPGQGAWREER